MAYTRALLLTPDDQISREQMWQLWAGLLITTGVIMVLCLTVCNTVAGGTMLRGVTHRLG